MKTYGLIGYRIGYSFSRSYFAEKFRREKLKDCEYLNFELDTISEFPALFKHNDHLYGFNCTIPYKQEIMAYLDELDKEAATVGAVNTVKIIRSGGQIKLKGYNSDTYGFEQSLLAFLGARRPGALILGTGGASKAVRYILEKHQMPFLQVTRSVELKENQIHYAAINAELLDEYQLVINATPVGTFPATDQCPDIPYRLLGSDHFLFDLIYNPDETLFLKRGKQQKAAVKNGLEMWHLQAERSWEIWNS